MIRIAILSAGSTEPFPSVENALDDPNGLLAAGGDLSPGRLFNAYAHGIFPWFSDGDPILWWSPDPRAVFATDKVHVSTRLRRWLRHSDWTIRADTDFARVMHECAAPRANQTGTWITQSIQHAYGHLHELGFAHCVEAYDGDELVGGIYGIALGRMFFGESMFSRATNGSKVALIALCRMLEENGFPLLDAQIANAHTRSMGATEMRRHDFVKHVAENVSMPGLAGNWRSIWPIQTARELA
jgi:leucyl/phenylalanyl-tRNA---protein transferase